MLKPSKAFSCQIFLLGAIAVAIILRIINLGTREFWYDEVLSLLLSTSQKGSYQTPGDVPVILANYTSLLSLPPENSITDVINHLEKFLKGLVAEPHPPLFFIGQHLWLRLFGNSEAAQRSLNVLYSLGAIASAYGVGLRLLGYRGGLIFAALLGLNDYYLFHSLNVRMYAPLVFWVIFSTWTLLQLIETNKSPDYQNKILWIVLFIGSVTGGLMTFYLFAYHLIALAVLVLLLDRKHWWHHGLRFVAGVLITTPWLWWGTRQQLRNADLGRFSASQGFLVTTWRHLNNVLQTLGIHLILGDWVSSLPPLSATIAGIFALLLIIFLSIYLWRQQQRQLLLIALTLGILPLLLALTSDTLAGKFTLGFGWGRSIILILPGCLLLLTIGLEKAAPQWQKPATLILLTLYLTISLTDFTLRPRWIFHQLADIISQQPTTPTLIAMNSKAWGHVMRLAYYLPPTSPISLLADSPRNLASSLKENLNLANNPYPRLIWLDSYRPVWSAPKTETAKVQFQEDIKTTINSQYKLTETNQLSGTMHLDKFTVYIYQRT